MSQNFLSDLGMTVAYDGRPNRLGALLFTLSLGALLIGLGGWLISVLRSYWREPRPRRLAQIATVVGLFVCAAFAAVGLTPENEVMARHVSVTLLAWRSFPALSLLLTLASARSSLSPRREPFGWGALTVLLVVYVVVLGWGPPLDTFAGLRVQVAAQKIATAGVIAIFLWLMIERDRLGTTTTQPAR